MTKKKRMLIVGIVIVAEILRLVLNIPLLYFVNEQLIRVGYDHSVVCTEYKYVDGEKKFSSRTEYYFDENGRILLKINDWNYDVVQYLFYKYDSLGRRVYFKLANYKKYSVVPKCYSEIENTEYFKDTNLISYHELKRNDDFEWFERFEYSEEGTKIYEEGNQYRTVGGEDYYRKVRYNENEVEIYREESYGDDSDGFPVQLTEYDPDTNIIKKYGVTFHIGDAKGALRNAYSESIVSSNGRIESTKKFNQDGKIFLLERFDDQGKEVFHAEYSEGVETLRRETVYKNGEEKEYLEFKEGVETYRRETVYKDGEEKEYHEFRDGVEVLRRETDFESQDPDYPGEQIWVTRTYSPDENGDMVMETEVRRMEYFDPSTYDYDLTREKKYNVYYAETRVNQVMKPTTICLFSTDMCIKEHKGIEYDENGDESEIRICKYDDHENCVEVWSKKSDGDLILQTQREYVYKD